MILYVGMFVYQSLAHLRVFTPNPFYILVVSRSQTYSWTVQVVFLLGYVGHMWAQRITNISRKSENDAPTFGKLMPKKPEHGNVGIGDAKFFLECYDTILEIHRSQEKTSMLLLTPISQHIPWSATHQVLLGRAQDS